MFGRVVVPKGGLILTAPTGVNEETRVPVTGAVAAQAPAAAAPRTHLLAVVGVRAETDRTIELTITHKSTSKPCQVTRTFVRGCIVSTGALFGLKLGRVSGRKHFQSVSKFLVVVNLTRSLGYVNKF